MSGDKLKLLVIALLYKVCLQAAPDKSIKRYALKTS